MIRIPKNGQEFEVLNKKEEEECEWFFFWFGTCWIESIRGVTYAVSVTIGNGVVPCGRGCHSRSQVSLQMADVNRFESSLLADDTLPHPFCVEHPKISIMQCIQLFCHFLLTNLLQFFYYFFSWPYERKLCPVAQVDLFVNVKILDFIFRW